MEKEGVSVWLRVVSIACACAFVLGAFQVAVGTASGEPVDSVPSPTDPPVGPGPGPGPIAGGEGDGPWNESDPDGDVNATFDSPVNATGGYANNTIEPYVVQDNTTYTFVTTLGNYTFPGIAPHAMSVHDLDERLMVVASSFVVEGDVATEISRSYVVSATNNTFHSRYNVTSGAVMQGVMDVTTLFNATQSPKILSVFTQDPNSTLSSWHVRWKVVTPAHYLRDSEDTTLYYGALSNPLMIGSSPELISPRALVGSDAELSLWNSTLTGDWADMVNGTLYVGPVVIDANFTGKGFMVAFPDETPIVDPTLVAQSSNSYATRFTTQKKVFFHDGRYYAFFAHLQGTTRTIRYAVGTETTSTMTWNPSIAVLTVSGDLNAGFDVDYRDGVVGIAWWDMDLATAQAKLGFVRGYVKGSWIDWSDPVTLRSNVGCDTAEGCIANVAVGSDGFSWVAMLRTEGSTGWLDSYRSTVPEGTTFALVDSFPSLDHRTAVRLVSLPGGDMMILSASYPSAEIKWWTWSVVTGLWGSPLTTSDLGLKANEAKSDKFTAVGTSNWGDGSSVAVVAYVDASGRLKRRVFFPTFSLSSYEIATGPVYHPAIEVDPNGDIHYFWTEVPCANCNRRIHYTRQDANGLLPRSQPFAPMGNPYHLSAPFYAQSQRAFLVYTSGGGQVYFASLPTRRGNAGGGEAGWSRPGLSPHGMYFQQLSESVSIGTGLLYVKHTDLSVPGRGLDLSIQRLYRTPNAFVSGNPWDYEEPTMYSLGRGWSLNFPWATPRSLYLWDGQRYVIKWNNNVFENKDGEYFRLERLPSGLLYLYTKSGVRYDLSPWYGIFKITDPNGNTIQFQYEQYLADKYRLKQIVDTRGRLATFSYVPNGQCPGLNMICSITYGGRTVSFRYIAGLLTTVVDPVGRLTAYEYCTAGLCSSVVNPWLVSAVSYTTGARTVYRYQSVPVGTDAVGYLVTTQKLQDAAYVTTKKKTVSYDVVNGAVAYAKVTQYAGDAESTRQAATLHNLDALAGTMTVAQLDAAGGKMNQQRLWFGPGGRVVQTDVYMGAAAADAGDVTYSTYVHHDEYGNIVYARDQMGRESFSSYVSSNNQSAFYGPGRLDLDAQYPGKILLESFRDRGLEGWSYYSAPGSVRLDSSYFGTLPPSLRIEDSSGTSGPTSASRGFPAQTTSHLVRVLVRANEKDRDHWFDIRQGTSTRTSVMLASDGKIKFLNGGNWQIAQGYEAGQWYWITLQLLVQDGSLSRFNLWVNNVWIGQTSFPMPSPGEVDNVYFKAGGYSATAMMWVNEVAVFRSRTITLQGIQLGTRVRALDARGKQIGADVLVSAGTAAVTLGPLDFPAVTLQVLDSEWTPIYTSPSREFWGGSRHSVVEPQFSSGIAKATSGFLRLKRTWLDVPPNPGTATSDGEGWSWQYDNRAATGASYHVSPEKAARHGHGFRDAPPFCADSGGEYYVQYAYLRPDAYPAEILRAYQAAGATSDWSHRAFWGDSLDGLGGTEGSDARRKMGAIPPVTDRWLELIVKHDDIANYGTVNCFKGTSYYLVSGGAYWDLTALGDVATGQVKLMGLPTGWKVVLKTPESYEMHSNDAIADTNGVATMDVYAAGSSFRNAFPTSGWFTVYQPGQGDGWTLVYRSPWFRNIFGGDVYQWSGSNFYTSSGMNSYIKDRLSGTYQVRGSDAQEVYYEYDFWGNLVEAKSKAPGGAWAISYRTYDLYGNVVSARSLYADGSYHTTTYEYSSPGYQHAYLTKVTDDMPGADPVTTLDYDYVTGELTIVKSPKGQATGRYVGYTYDAVGRLIMETLQDFSHVFYDYYDSGRLVVIRDEMWNGVDRKRQTWQCYDDIGRLEEVLRFGDAGPMTAPSCLGLQNSGYYSRESYSYNWQDQVTVYSSATGRQYRRDFDALGRPTRIWNPDLATGVDILYDDGTNTKTVSVTAGVQSPRKTQYSYDLGGNLKEVREFYGTGPSDYHMSSYTYDAYGRLWKVETPPDALPVPVRQVTMHSYDLLDRLERTDYPDGTHEQYWYSLANLLSQKRDRAGGMTNYMYDELKRTWLVTYPDGSSATHYYDGNGNIETLTYVQPGPATVTLAYTYDDRDRMLTETSTVGGTPYAVSYEYDYASNVKRIQGPAGSGYDVYYAYDAFNRVCGVSSSAVAACADAATHAKLSYNADDMLDTITYETGTTDATTEYLYNTNGYPQSIKTNRGMSQYLRIAISGYTSLGDPTYISTTGESITTTTETYEYDALGRLDVSNSAGSWSWALDYAYDALGNRLSVTDGGTGTHYRYDTYSRLCRTKVGSAPTSCTETGSQVNEYAYGAKGETISRKVDGPLWTFTWGAQGRLASTTAPSFSASYLYDGLGRRVRSVISTGGSPATNVYVFSGLTPIYETNGCHRYVYANGLRIAKVSGCSPQTKSYYHYDHLGNVRAITDGNGNLQAILAYKPFGLCVYGCASEPTYGYTGEYREAAPNLVYLHSRWYDPTIGRFLSADDRLGRLSMPQDQNRYAYVVNNPMKYTDPTGHDWADVAKWILIGLTVLAIILTAGAMLAVFAAYAAAASVGFAASAATTAFMTLATNILIGGTIAGLAVGTGSAIGAAVMGHDVGQAFGYGFLGGFGGAAGAFGLGYFRSLATGKPQGSILQTLSRPAAEGKNAQRAAREGTDIVGTEHNAMRPTQNSVSKSKVLAIAEHLESGGEVPPIDVARTPNGQLYISDGHHRYVAAQLTRRPVPVKYVDVDEFWGYPDWSRVVYEP